jgi:hypothetical protein
MTDRLKRGDCVRDRSVNAVPERIARLPRDPRTKCRDLSEER